MAHTRTESVRPAGVFAVAAILVSGAFAGCAFTDGDPWGEARFSLTVALDADGRATEEGYRTSDDFLVRVDVLELDVASISAGLAAGDGAVAFDPANPPDGYSLCHGGHCHADDGSLVDYEDIALELAGGANAAVSVVQAIDATVALDETPTAMPLEDCTDDCALPLGTVSTVTVQPTQLAYAVHVTDQRPEDRRRLPEGGIALAGTTDLSSGAVASVVSATLDGRRPPVLELDVALTLSATFLDGVDWTAADGAIGDALAARFAEAAALSVAVTRTDF